MHNISLKNIEMKFGDFKALRDINIEFHSGEVHTLLGENGAGKSTLISLIQGINKPTLGSITLTKDGESKKLKSTVSDSKKNRIYVIPQHFELVDNTTVLDNILISTISKEKFWVNRQEQKKKIQEIIDNYNIDVKLDDIISNLTIGKKQMVEVIRMLWNESETIILDEPTAVLSKDEIQLLFKLIKKLKDEGKMIIFISHKLDEIFQVSDKVSVLRKGKLINTHKNNSKLTHKKLIGDMTNNTFSDQKLIDYGVKDKFNKEILKVTDLCVKGHNLRSTLKNINFTVNAGEIVAIASIDGNGEETLFEALIGLRQIEEGFIYKDGKDIAEYSISDRYKTNIAYVPSDRHHNGLILDLPIFSNLVLNTYDDKSYYKFNLFFNYIKGKRVAKEILNSFDVRGAENISDDIKALSGGNQQKVLVAREVNRDADLLLLSQPTRGIDVKAIQNIYLRILEEKKKGRGILLYTTELEEIEAIADKVLVISNGEIKKVLVNNQIKKMTIMESLVK